MRLGDGSDRACAMRIWFAADDDRAGGRSHRSLDAKPAFGDEHAWRLLAQPRTLHGGDRRARRRLRPRRVSLRQPPVRRAGECRRVHVAEECCRARLTLDQRGAATRDVVRAAAAASAAPRRPKEERLERLRSYRSASSEQLVD